MSNASKMTSIAFSITAICLLGTQAMAQTDSTAAAPKAAKSAGGKSCEELKSEISAKITAKGVKAFTLDIVPTADVKDAKVVGSCEGGSKKITYKRG